MPAFIIGGVDLANLADFCIFPGRGRVDLYGSGVCLRLDGHPFLHRWASVFISMGIRLEMDAYAW